MSELRRRWAREGQKKEMKEYSNREIAGLIDDLIHNERNRAILKRRLIDGICYEPLAEEFDLSVRHVKSIVYKEQERLFKNMP